MRGWRAWISKSLFVTWGTKLSQPRDARCCELSHGVGKRPIKLKVCTELRVCGREAESLKEGFIEIMRLNVALSTAILSPPIPKLGIITVSVFGGGRWARADDGQIWLKVLCADQSTLCLSVL